MTLLVVLNVSSDVDGLIHTTSSVKCLVMWMV